MADMDDVIPSELRAILKLTLKSSDNLVSALNEDFQEPPVVRELIEAILFSRHFVPSYLAVLVTAVIIWAITKRLIVYFSSHGKPIVKRQPEVTSSVASSSSSTLKGTESPPIKDDEVVESTPLLAEAQLRCHETRSLHLRVWHNVRFFLLRQPKPIPSLTAPKNTLPANQVSIVILLFLFLNVFYLFYRMPFSGQNAFVLADRAGLLFVINLPVLYILAAKNNQPLGWITGWSYEGLNIFHRRLGEWMTIITVLHAIGMIVGFYQLLAPFGYTLMWYLTRRIIIFGVVGFACYVAIYFTSIGYVRQAMYELFLAVHIFLQVAALVMLFFHHHHARPWVGFALIIWILDRGISRIACKTKSFIATLEVARDGETVLLYCDIPLRQGRACGMHGGWFAGQHVFLTIPDMGSWQEFQAHPFTIASPAPGSVKDVSWPLQLTIRAQDGFSRKLLEYAKFHSHARISLDGPYSSCDVLSAVKKSDRVALIAGGSGIAVTYPFAWAREAESGLASDIVHNRKRYIAGRKHLPNITPVAGLLDEHRFAHFWIRQDNKHESWLTMLPSTSQNHVETNDTYSDTSSTIDLITHRFDTRSATGQHQRPDIQTELEAWVHGDLKQDLDVRETICIVVSGPDSLVRDIQNAVADLVRKGWNIQIHIEKFGW